MKKLILNSKQGKLVVIAATLASGMSFLATTMVGIALPRIQEYFGTSISNIQWVVNGYLLALAVLILVSGSLGDRYGQKKIFLSGVFVFTLASFLSGLAAQIEYLIFFQIIQGIGAAMMIPGSLAILSVCFRSYEKGKVVGLWAGLSGAIAALGPFLAGWLVYVFDWRGVLFFNLPMGIIVFLVAYFFVPRSKPKKIQNLDVLGAFLIGGFLGFISFVLISGPSRGWFNPIILGLFLISLLFLVGFYFRERFAKNPLIPFSFFRQKILLGANLATFFLYFALNSTIFFLIINFQQVQGYSPIDAGLAILPITLMIAWLSGPSGSITDIIGPRLQMIAGPIMVALSMATISNIDLDGVYVFSYFPAFILLGAGMAFVIAPLTKSALSVKESFSGAASGINNSVARIASLMAIAVTGALILGIYNISLESNVSSLNIGHEEKSAILAQKDKLVAIDIPTTLSKQESILAREAIGSSFEKGFKAIMYINAFFAFLASMISYFFIGERPTLKRLRLFKLFLRYKPR